MIIHNSLAGLQTLNQMNRNEKARSGAANKVATGEKFSGAGEAASEYSISEKMRVQIRGLNQCVDNTKNGRNMLDIAAGAVEEQVDIMKTIRSLALKASDDVYSQEDRAIIQREIAQMLDECEDLAQSTDFNGIPLLNQYTITDQDFWFDPDAPYRPIPSTIPVIPEAAAGVPDAEGKLSYTVPQGDYIDITIAGIGGSVTTNVYDPTTWTKGNALSAMPRVGDMIFDVSGNQDTVIDLGAGILGFSSTGTAIEIAGIANGGLGVGTTTNVFAATHPPLTSMPVPPATVCDSSGRSYRVAITPGKGTTSYVVPSNRSFFEVNFNDLITSLRNIPRDLNELGFSLDCGDCDQFVTIKFDANTDTSQVYGGNPNSTTRDPICYVIGVKDVTNAQTLGTAIFNGLGAASGITTGSAPSPNKETARIAMAHDIEMNYYPNGNFTISKSESGSPNMTLINGIKGEMMVTNYFEPYQDLSLQTNTSSSQYLNLRINNTTLKSLFPPFNAQLLISPKPSDFPTDWPQEYQWNHDEKRPMTTAEKQAKWTKEVWKYPASRVPESEISVLTQDKANKFIDHVDQALKYLIYTDTKLGAQSNRLNYTEANLVTASENTTASESTIRDANLGKEMTEKVKQDILSQTSQSMLAQANQLSSNVLNLLQA